MAYAPINRARALIICTRPQDFAPSRVYAAACYLETLANVSSASRRMQPTTSLLQSEIIVEMEIRDVHCATIWRTTGWALHEFSDQAVLDAEHNV